LALDDFLTVTQAVWPGNYDMIEFVKH